VRWTVTTPPAARPVEWATFKAHARLTGDDEQELGELYLDAAADYAAEAMGCSLMAQTITATFYTGEPVILPRGPVIQIVSVTDARSIVLDDDGNEVTDEDGNTVTDDDGHALTYNRWKVGHSDRLRINGPFVTPLIVEYTAGYPTADAIPASIRQGILVHAATLYEQRESVSDRTKTPVPHSLADFYRLKSRHPGVG
jgi:uncharacterized phiE125 gp8 family phage protein